MKYEMILGDEMLFDGIPEYVEIIRYNDYSRDYLWSDISMLPHLSFLDLKAIPVVAMRRIIRTPTWTVADQKAGMLPEVGCRVDFCHKLNTNWRTGEIKYIDDQVAVIKADAIDRPFVYEVDRVEFKPIESPEEKAERLREEWVDSSLQKIKRRNWTDAQIFSQIREFIGDIYDAQLSGDLPVPVKEQP